MEHQFIRHIIVSLVFTSSTIVSQTTGKLNIHLTSLEPYTKNITNENITCIVYDSTTSYTLIRDKEFSHHFTKDSILLGNYSTSIFLNGRIILNIKNNIKIIENHENYFTLDLLSEQIGLSRSDTLNNAELSYNALFGNSSWLKKNDNNTNEILSFNVSFSDFYSYSKYASIGFITGFQYNRTNFYNDTTTYFGKNPLYKHYASTTFNLGVIKRFTFYNNKKKNSNGLKLDLGITYNFPLYFKQIVKTDADTKLISRHLHRYNDFTAFTRLSYGFIGLNAEYRLLDFLKKNYTENPPLKLGIVFFIPEKD